MQCMIRIQNHRSNQINRPPIRSDLQPPSSIVYRPCSLSSVFPPTSRNRELDDNDFLQRIRIRNADRSLWPVWPHSDAWRQKQETYSHFRAKLLSCSFPRFWPWSMVSGQWLVVDGHPSSRVQCVYRTVPIRYFWHLTSQLYLEVRFQKLAAKVLILRMKYQVRSSSQIQDGGMREHFFLKGTTCTRTCTASDFGFLSSWRSFGFLAIFL